MTPSHQTNTIPAKDSVGYVSFLSEIFVLLSTSALIAVTFLSDRRSTVFEVICLVALILFKVVHKRNVVANIPPWVVVIVYLYLLSEAIGAFMSIDVNYAIRELRRFVHVFIAGLLFTVPIRDKNRKILTVVFFITAAIAGIAGILQYMDILSTRGVYGGIEQFGRPRGFSSNAILYASILAVACSTSIIILFTRNDDLRTSLAEQGFLLIISLFTAGGIIVSLSRGVWISIIIACIITLLIYNSWRAVYFIVSLLLVCTIVLSLYPDFRERAESIVTSVYSEKRMESTGYRLELWKGSFLLFKDHPIFGVGTWNFQSAIDTYIQKGILKPIPDKMHAHNIYLHALATRGIIGFLLTISLLIVSFLWGKMEVRCYGGIGGYIIILITVLACIGGLTEINLDINQILATQCLAIGLMGPFRATA